MAQTYKICLLPGDGIGPEIIAEGVKVLDAIAAKYGVSFEYTEALIGGRAIDETGSALPEATLAIASGSDAVLLAAVGGPKWDTTDPSKPVSYTHLDVYKRQDLFSSSSICSGVRVCPKGEKSKGIEPVKGFDVLKGLSARFPPNGFPADEPSSPLER